MGGKTGNIAIIVKLDVNGCDQNATNQWKTKTLVPVVQKVDSAIHRINLYPVDRVIGFPDIYPVDSD